MHKSQQWHCRISILLLISTFSAQPQANDDSANESRPNILLIVADDLGYADLGVFGSSIRTPQIDALAREGLRFTAFHTAPMCAPTRAMLLSGNNNHVAGMGRQSPNDYLQENLPAYEGHLSDRIIPLPRLMLEAGYHTYTVGKWHLGTEAENSPKAVGFEKSFGVVEGAASHYDGRGFENAETIYREDGELTTWPEGAYSTELYTDKLIGYIDAHINDGQPFFAFAAYTSPHWPLQVPEDELNRYAGQYDAGYDALREQNFTTLQATDIVPPEASLPPRNPAITPWQELDATQQQQESRKMELYAAMVENLDGHIGRLLDYLKQSGQYDNTIIVFMSDNGAAAEDFYNKEPYKDYVQQHYTAGFEDWGGPDSFVSYGAPWAEAGAAPFKRYKGYTSEGGITAPMIIAGNGVMPHDTINRSYLTVMDLAPTFIELAQTSYPQDGSVVPLKGESLTPLLSGETEAIHSPDYITVLSHRGRSLVRQGDWKLNVLDGPFEESKFELFNLANDPGETTDLSSSNPEKREELLNIWREQRKELGIVLPEDL